MSSTKTISIDQIEYDKCIKKCNSGHIDYYNKCVIQCKNIYVHHTAKKIEYSKDFKLER